MTDLDTILTLRWRIANISLFGGRFNATAVKTGHNTVVHGNGRTLADCLSELRGAVEMLQRADTVDPEAS